MNNYTEQELQNALRIQRRQILAAINHCYEYKTYNRGKWNERRERVIKLDDIEEILDTQKWK